MLKSFNVFFNIPESITQDEQKVYKLKMNIVQKKKKLKVNIPTNTKSSMSKWFESRDNLKDHFG